jgi:hypothetical protein
MKYVQGVTKRALQMYSEDIYSVLNCHDVGKHTSFTSDSYVSDATVEQLRESFV